ncbi:hypothetical protein [Phaeobacter gallaeciensis]|uniref:hypothetical protein n=1 Tax=Phaeobacter gallaeciensis TaxID=60890 RepID=UPI000BBC5CC6|nr:hypothetical protein [Phaeobacter gallaeciensis]ATF17940.1 hypothetical protein PhaeoP129_01303 [Phaeobacter gallaeciensis]ATF22049.1 hypothetical protein PhaeoP128_01303 [Phaeobacter gallaeciensis]
MIGVVLWTDYDLRQAVIWCEDHGDLVYYRWTALDAPPALSKGDCVAFHVETKGALRLAGDLRIIEESQSPELAAKLVRAEHDANLQPPKSRSKATVMSWEDARRDPLYPNAVEAEGKESELSQAGSYGVPDVRPAGGATVVSFPDKKTREARAQTKRRSG